MKKSLIAMALMFGAVVFIASCGGGGNKEECNCQWRLTTAGVASADYPTANVCRGTAAPALGTLDAAAHKGDSYTLSCP